VRISAKADYAVRAAIELAVAGSERPTKGDTVAQAQGIPLKFLENILADMRHAGLITSRRGAEGGYWLARPADDITVADIIRAVEGPLASVRAAQRRRGSHPRGSGRRQARPAGRGAGEGSGGVGNATLTVRQDAPYPESVSPVTRR